MALASASLNVQALPDWAFWVFALIGFGASALVLFRMMPPALRLGSAGRSVALAFVVFFGGSALSHGGRSLLWIGAIAFLLISFPLLWIGKMPADMPSARDPRARSHPKYQEIAKRGRIAGIAIVIIIVVDLTLTTIFVRGL